RTEGERRARHLVTHPAAVDHDVLAVAEQRALEPRDHGRTTAGTSRTAVGRSRRPWVIATASASVASARGRLRRPISACTIRAIWVLSARPHPDTAFLTSA